MAARELTRDEKKKIRSLVMGMCANYDRESGLCLPLDCACYMLHKCWTCLLYTSRENLPQLVLHLFSEIDMVLCREIGRQLIGVMADLVHGIAVLVIDVYKRQPYRQPASLEYPPPD